MARIDSNTNLMGCCILVLITLFTILTSGVVDGKIAHRQRHGTVKTLQLKNGDLIDCVDIYKQPAFSHPLLKNHTIQFKPASDPTDRFGLNTKIEPLENMFEAVQCPEGTIPIVRNHQHNFTAPQDSDHLDEELNTIFRDPPNHEYAEVTILHTNMFGAQATINVWNPHVELDNELSMARISVIGGRGKDRETIMAGWKVSPIDNDPRFFIGWSTSNAGCVDLDCAGFVVTNTQFSIIGGLLQPYSLYMGNQYDIYVKIYQEKETGKWWVRFQDQILGYWPRKLFNILVNAGANRVIWGGHIINHEKNGRHTSTDMGSGHTPSTGFGKAAFFRKIGYIDYENIMTFPENKVLETHVSKPQCYDVRIVEQWSSDFGTQFYYGGPDEWIVGLVGKSWSSSPVVLLAVFPYSTSPAENSPSRALAPENSPTWSTSGTELTSNAGCVDLDCAGFVVTNTQFSIIGGLLQPYSLYMGNQYDIYVKIYQEKETGKWWVRFQDQILGYWPRKLFNILVNAGANRVIWGGHIINHEKNGRHTSTDMGSGHTPSTGFGKAAFFRKIGYIDYENIMTFPENKVLETHVSKPQCYDVRIVEQWSSDFGTQFYYGGPGLSGRCRS
ncbi:hypothetical protein ACFE04_003986 [Oxalis oulophora]